MSRPNDLHRVIDGTTYMFLPDMTTFFKTRSGQYIQENNMIRQGDWDGPGWYTSVPVWNRVSPSSATLTKVDEKYVRGFWTAVAKATDTAEQVESLLTLGDFTKGFWDDATKRTATAEQVSTLLGPEADHLPNPRS